MSDLMAKLAQSNARALMASDIKPSRDSFSSPSMDSFSIPNVKYNIPEEFLQEQPSTPNMPNMTQPYLSSLPVENTKPVGVPTVEAIKNSKLPDEIKKLMMEHPISQPQQQQSPTLSDELVERASRLMRETKGGYVPESATKKETQSSQQPSGNIDYKVLQKMINEAVNNALRENGLLVESSEKTGETFSFRVGKHIFEGKVNRIKKLS